MKYIEKQPADNFSSIEIDHQYLEGTDALLNEGIPASCGDCFLDDAIALDKDFSDKYTFSYLPKTEAQGTLYIIPISN